LSVWELAFVAFGGFFYKKVDPFIWNGHNFFNSIIFLTIFNALDMLIGKIQVLLDVKKYGAFPLDLACLQGLSVIVAIQLRLMNNKKI
jgi:hypothetical protein